MATIRFTDLSVRSLPVGTFFDERTPCFGIRVGKRRRTWIVVKDQTRAKVRLGHYPDLSLADARKRALVALGSPLALPSAPPFPEARAEFLAQGKWRDNSRKQIARMLTTYFHWTKPIDQITNQDVAQALAHISKPSEAWHAHKDIRAFFNACVPRYIKSSPVIGIKSPSRYIPRERVLSDIEVERIWHATDPQDIYGATIRLLFLCGQRLTQTSLMRLDWIERETITFPAWACKNNRTQKLPLPKSAIPLIEVLRPFKNWQKRKPLLNEASGVQNWCHHDARRYFATAMQRLGVRLEVTENLLGHSESRAGVIGIYQRHDFWPEMQEAVDKYEQFLLNLIRPC
jgi:integrase